METLNDLQLIAEVAKVDNEAVRELIRRFNEARFKAEILEEKYNHQLDIVHMLRTTLKVTEKV